jgi:hypothetical protein
MCCLSSDFPDQKENSIKKNNQPKIWEHFFIHGEECVLGKLLLLSMVKKGK